MSRPKPVVIMTYTCKETYRSEQILEAESIYAVYYDGQPINIRSVNSLVDYPGPKYRKSSFSNSGHAFNLADKLNTLFKTDKFSVYQLTEGTKIDEKVKPE